MMILGKISKFLIMKDICCVIDLQCTCRSICLESKQFDHGIALDTRQYLVKKVFHCVSIATDKRGYPHNIFLISRRKHMLWVLIRSALLSTKVLIRSTSPRRF